MVVPLEMLLGGLGPELVAQTRVWCSLCRNQTPLAPLSQTGQGGRSSHDVEEKQAQHARQAAYLRSQASVPTVYTLILLIQFQFN